MPLELSCCVTDRSTWISEAIQLLFSLRVPGNDRKTCFRAETLHMGVSKNRVFTQYEWFISWKPLLEWMIWGENPLFSATPIWQQTHPKAQSNWAMELSMAAPLPWLVKVKFGGKICDFFVPKWYGIFFTTKIIEMFFLVNKTSAEKKLSKRCYIIAIYS